MSVRSRSSCRQVCTQQFHDRVHAGHLDACEYDAQAGVVEDVSKVAVNLQSRSRIMNFALLLVSSRSMVRFRASCVA
jgi:hypothetical protein